MAHMGTDKHHMNPHAHNKQKKALYSETVAALALRKLDLFVF